MSVWRCQVAGRQMTLRGNYPGSLSSRLSAQAAQAVSEIRQRLAAGMTSAAREKPRAGRGSGYLPAVAVYQRYATLP